MTPSFWKDKKVFLTGHTGFKGSWLSLWLHSLGAQVTGLALAPEPESFFNACKIEQKIKSEIGDIRNPDLVRQSMLTAKPDIVLHLAAQALVRPSYADPLGTMATNVMGTAHVLEAVRQATTVKSCVVVTSDKCYENHETTRGYKESDAMGGWDPYSASKGCTELVTASWTKSFFSDKAVGIASGRAGNVIGGGDYSVDRLIPDCVRAFRSGKKISLRNPKATRPWQHVLEPLSGYLTLAEKNYQDPNSFRGGWNFGPGPDQELTVGEVVADFSKYWGEGAGFEFDTSKQPHEAGLLKLDCTKAHEKLNWKPALGWQENMHWTADWYKAAIAGSDMAAFSMKQIQAFQEKHVKGKS